MPDPLPEFIEPMLARQGEPFDSAAHLFEIKWDGTRAQARLPGDGYTLTNRRRRDLTGRYPELQFLGDLEPGHVLDGEIVVMRDGRPDLGELMTREHARQDLRIQSLSRSAPATYVVFDMLYADGVPIMAEPLTHRRERLREFVAKAGEDRMLLSEGVVETGLDYFAAAIDRDLEGVMAKRLAGPYEPGRRTGDWLKIKQKHTLHCAIVGFVAERDDVRSLIIAARMEDDGGPQLRCVGKVGSGLTAAMRRRLAELLFARLRPTPFLPCEEHGLFVEPGLYCVVSYLERTRAGQLRAPVFRDLIVDS